MKIVLLQAGKTTERYISAGVEDYSGRIMKLAAFEIITVPDLKNTRNMPVAEHMNREGRLLLQAIDKDDFVILLHRGGKRLDTLQFAGELEKFLILRKKRIVFVIGGAWGVSDEVHSRADFKLSLSDMTFSHQLVRLLFMEQLYRVLTIIKGIPYHH